MNPPVAISLRPTADSTKMARNAQAQGTVSKTAVVLLASILSLVTNIATVTLK